MNQSLLAKAPFSSHQSPVWHWLNMVKYPLEEDRDVSCHIFRHPQAWVHMVAVSFRISRVDVWHFKYLLSPLIYYYINITYHYTIQYDMYIDIHLIFTDIYIYIHAQRLGFAQALQRRGSPFPIKCCCNSAFHWEDQQRHYSREY